MSSSNNRDRVRDPREEILLETNFDDEGVLTTAYNNHHPNKKRLFHRSDGSLDRYSENSLHGLPNKGDCCRACLTRVPYATLIAMLMCLLGVGIFCSTMYRGATLTVVMFNDVFNFRLVWIETVQMTFVIIAAIMAALGFMILFIGFLATGATRHKVYRAWRSRIGGRISCAVFMGITYFLTFVWILITCFLVIVTFLYTISWNLCKYHGIRSVIDLEQFRFMFPSTVKEGGLVLKDAQIKAFCNDAVVNSGVMFIVATMASLLIVLSLIHYLMCLSANYAHIRDHEKFQELQELQNLTELEYSAVSKDRF